MRKPILHVFLATWMFFIALVPQQLWAKGSKSAFDQAVADLQKSPEDRELRKKIIRLAQEKDGLPAMPEEVMVLKGKAAYVMKSANSAADYQKAVEAYRDATTLAPWSGDLYYNLGVVEEKAEEPADAIEDFKLYLLAKPDADDKSKVLERLGKLEVMQDKKSQETERVVRHQQSEAKTSEAMKAWQGRATGALVVGILGGLTLALGATFLGIGYSDEGGALYTTTPGYSGGVLYNHLYEGKYYSSTSYKDYTDGVSDVSTGWLISGIGCGAILIAILMSPGPQPTNDALLNLNEGKLALGLPDMQPTQYGGVQGTLLHATF